MSFRVERRPHPSEGIRVTNEAARTAGRYLHCRVYSFMRYQREDGTWMDRLIDQDDQTASAAEKIAAALNADCPVHELEKVGVCGAADH